MNNKSVEELARKALELSDSGREEYLQSLENCLRDDVQKRILALSSADEATFVPQASSWPEADRNLLFGILAWQAGLLTEKQLLDALQQWPLQRQMPLGQILVQQSVLTAEQNGELKQMVDAHVRLHHEDAEAALRSLSSISSFAIRLNQNLQNDELNASLGHLVQTVVPLSGNDQTNEDPSGERLAGRSRFKVIRPHARGGLGEVFVAKDRELNREVALKEIQSRFADHTDSRSRFLLEAEVTGGLEHPGIVPVYGLGSYEDGRPYYAMRFIKGDSLKEAIAAFHHNTGLNQSDRTLKLRKLLGRFTDVCQAIGYAHSRGVLHRDLKPGNIMLGKYGETLVVDWGLAKVAGKEEVSASDEQTIQPTSGSGMTPTIAGSAIGTPAYMPPEQATGDLDQLGPASDVYSLGATLYHLLTGKAAFEKGDLAATLLQVQNGIFPSPREVRDDIPKPIEAVCLKAMALKPVDRYSSPQALADDVERFLADEPVSAIDEPFLVRAQRWIRNHKTLTVSAAASAAVALFGLIAFERHESERFRNDAIQQAETAATEKQLRDQADTKAEEARLAEELAVSRLNRSNYFLADARLKSFRPEEASALLRQIPPDSRKIEWHLLNRQLQGCSAVFYGHQFGVRSVEFSPDGRRLVSAGGDGTIRVVDLESGESRVFNDSDTGGIVAFDPTGRLLATARGETVLIWNFETNELRHELKDHRANIVSIDFDPAGRRLVSAAREKKINTWDVISGKKLRTYRGHERDAVTVRFSSDPKLIASTDFSNRMKVWEAETGKTLHSLHSRTNFDFFQSGERIAVFFDPIRILDVKTGEVTSSPVARSGLKIMAIDPSGEKLAAVDRFSHAIFILDRSGAVIREFSGHVQQITSCCFGPNGRRLATASKDSTVRIWDTEESEVHQVWNDHRQFVNTIAVSPDSTLIASGSDDKSIHVHDLASGELKSILKGHTSEVVWVGFGSEDSVLFSGGLDGIRRWNLDSQTQTQFAPGGRLFCLSCNRKFLASSNARQIDIWSTETGKLTHSLSMNESFFSLEFRPDSSGIAVGFDGSVEIWDFESRALFRSFKGHDDLVSSCSFSRDGKRLVSGSWDRSIRIWNVETGNQEKRLVGHRDSVESVKFTNDGHRIVSAGADATIRVWDSESEEELLVLNSNQDEISQLVVAAGGIFTCADDGSVRHWDASRILQSRFVQTVPAYTRSLGACVHPDGKQIAFGDWEQVHIYDSQSGKLIQKLTGLVKKARPVGFTKDGRHLIVRDDSKRHVWETEKYQPVAEDTEFSIYKPAPGAPIAVPVGSELRMVDTRFHTTAIGSGLLNSTKPNAVWHLGQAGIAEQNGQLYAAAFHRAWQLKLDPLNFVTHDKLQKAIKNLDENHQAGEKPSRRLPIQLLSVIDSPRPQVAPDDPTLLPDGYWQLGNDYRDIRPLDSYKLYEKSIVEDRRHFGGTSQLTVARIIWLRKFVKTHEISFPAKRSIDRQLQAWLPQPVDEKQEISVLADLGFVTSGLEPFQALEFEVMDLSIAGQASNRQVNATLAPRWNVHVESLVTPEDRLSRFERRQEQLEREGYQLIRKVEYKRRSDTKYIALWHRTVRSGDASSGKNE